MSNLFQRKLGQLILVWMMVLVLTVGCATQDIRPSEAENTNSEGVTASDLETPEETPVEKESAYSRGVVQNTLFGSVKGYKDEESNALVWLGIPYAKAPVGELRWKAPVDPEPWSSELDVTAPGNLGIQLANGDIVGSEDCLNLDVFRPDSDATGLPVLVFVHGGNNQTGTSAELDVRKFVEASNCIVVSMNYRLGVLGFNNLPALKSDNALENSGNYALLDMSKSLEWVQNNIEYFGGDSQNVTVSGFSAGGRDVMAMLTSPLFEGQFQKAITFSGGMTMAPVEGSQKVIAKAVASLVVEDGLYTSEDEAYNWLLSEDEKVKDYLYGVEGDRLAKLMGNAMIRMSVFPHLFTDGTVLPENGFQTTSYNSVPLVMVTGSSEFSLFARYDKAFIQYDDEKLMTDKAIQDKLLFAIKYGSMMYEYFNAEESAEKMINSYNAPIYTCDFDWGTNPDVSGEKMSTIFGSFHGVWIPFMTGMNTGFSALFPDAYQGEGTQMLEAAFTAYMTNFLWSGDPNGEGLVKWEAWTKAGDGPTQLHLDADQTHALIEMSYEHQSYEAILEEMKNDDSISEEDKAEVIETVLNGRWFSAKLDEVYGNADLWSK